MHNDYSRLYAQLRLEPDCSLEELRCAYRKRVAELHPDRAGDAPPATEPQLAALISLYRQALQFHAVHGRLPGSPARPVRAAPELAHVVSPVPVPVTLIDVAGVDDAGTAPGIHRRRAWLAAVGIAIWQLWLCWPTAHDASQGLGDAGDSETEPTPSHLPALLSPGMGMDSVLAIQGPPSLRSDTLWEYGPSWLRFEDGVLVEWHSSPLYRLKVREGALAGASP
ncbi:MAG: J domain-containing protein [Pseudoxanthomonas sp.]